MKSEIRRCNMKKLISGLLALIIVLSCVFMVSACKLTDETKEPDADTVIAQIGEYKLTYGEFKTSFDMHASMWSSYGYDVMSDQETREEFQDNVFDLLVGTLVTMYKGDELGLFDFTDEQKAELREKIDAELTDLVEYHTKTAAESGLTGDELDAEIEKLIIEEAEYFLGEGTTRTEYEEYLKKAVTEDYKINIVKEAVLKDVTVSDDDIQTWYEATLESDKQAVEENPGCYKDDQEQFEMYTDNSSTYPVLYVPSGYYRVMHIFTTNTEDIDADYSDLSKELVELTNEYGRLSIEDATSETPKNTERLAEIVNEYKEKKAKMDKIFSEHYAGAKKIEEAYAKLESGEDFADVMVEYTEDADIIACEIFKEKGMLISRYESETDWSDEIKDKFFALSEGQYSEIFTDDNGYHILYYVGPEPMGSKPVDEIREAALKDLLETARTEEWDKLISEWLNLEELWTDVELIRSCGVPTTGTDNTSVS